jgi:hypothetical protein
MSLFARVAYFCGKTKSFTVICDDLIHGSTHLLCAFLIRSEVYRICKNTYTKEKYVPDGTLSLLNNRHELYALASDSLRGVTGGLIFAATACDRIGDRCQHYATTFLCIKKPFIL